MDMKTLQEQIDLKADKTELKRVEEKVDRILEMLKEKDSSTFFEKDLIKIAKTVNSELDRMFEERQRRLELHSVKNESIQGSKL